MDHKADYKTDFVEFMVRSHVLLFGEFTTKSGRNSPYFINTGNYRTGAQIRGLGRFYADCVLDAVRAGRLAADVAALFGPAYKGIPLAVAAAGALSERGMQLGYCFNRKESKDHGEGGDLVGYQPRPGDKLVITEDVITAGTAVRACLPLIERLGARAEALVVSVDRMERGSDGRTAAAELLEDYGIRTFSIVTAQDLIERLHNRPVDGVVHVDDARRERMEAYMAEYCV
jgi:orotate phosphoribosyltransferase